MDADPTHPEAQPAAGPTDTGADPAGPAHSGAGRRTAGALPAALTAVAVLAAVVGLVLAVGHAREDGAGSAGSGPVVADGAAAAGATTTSAAAGAAAQPAGSDGHEHSHGSGGTADGHDGHGSAESTGAGEHSHGESDTAYADLPAATRAQVDIARAIAARYPTAADAKQDGWIKATYNLEGIGSHYLKGGVSGFATDGVFDLNAPEILLFDGEGDDAPIAGVSYLVNGADPDGFEGDYDVWHRHSGVCFRGGIVVAEVDGHEGSRFSMGAQQCRDGGGMIFPIGNLTMLHVWVGKGYEDAPVFAHDNPKLYHGTPVGQPSQV